MNLYRVTKFPPYFSFTVYCFYTKISSFTPVLSTRIVLDLFYLLIFHSEKFSTDVCRLPYAVNVNLNLSTFIPDRSISTKGKSCFFSFLGAVLKGNLAGRSKCWTYNRQTVYDRNLWPVFWQFNWIVWIELWRVEQPNRHKAKHFCAEIKELPPSLSLTPISSNQNKNIQK